MTTNNRARIGVIGAAAIGVGGMVGGGIFAVLGTAVALGHGGTPVAFLIAGIVAALTAYSYAKLSVAFPSRGGTVVFLDRAFGVDLMTGSLNVTLWLSYLVTIALYASAFASYGATFLSNPGLFTVHLLISIAIVGPAALNLLNADLISKSESIIVAVKLALLGIVVVAGLGHIESSRLAVTAWSSPMSLVIAGMIIFVAYEGFELIANAAEDTRDPGRVLPRAYLLCVGFVIAIYVLVAAVTVGSVPLDVIHQAKDYALAEAAKPSLGRAGFVIVSVAALLATLSAVNATIYGNARLGYILARDGELPEIFERDVWHRPISGVALTAGLSLLLANLADLQSIAIMGSAGFLLIFAFVNAAAVRLASRIAANRLLCIVATIACAAALLALLHNAWRTNVAALFVFGGMLLSAVLFELSYGRFVRKRLKV